MRSVPINPPYGFPAEETGSITLAGYSGGPGCSISANYRRCPRSQRSIGLGSLQQTKLFLIYSDPIPSLWRLFGRNKAHIRPNNSQRLGIGSDVGFSTRQCDNTRVRQHNSATTLYRDKLATRQCDMPSQQHDNATRRQYDNTTVLQHDIATTW